MMRRFVLGLALTALVAARPELYREKEDFQYSRSSTDEGSQSGYYGAQRGNMGGNYERAHNMDSLAQHQMGGAIKQVEGELGDGAKTVSGSVYTAANSRGLYGSGHYDLSSVAGRNFQEGASYGASNSHSSTTGFGSEGHSSSQNSARYSSSHSESSGHSGYRAANTQALQDLLNAGQYERGSQSERNSRYYIQQSGYQGEDLYNQQSNINHGSAQVYDANTHNRLTSTVPVKIYVRPGQRVLIPVATETDGGSAMASNYHLNKANSEAELINIDDQQTNIKPSVGVSGQGKHYESSYSYQKQWEKHGTRPEVVPLAVPTESSHVKNSELFDNYQSLLNTNLHTQQADRNVASSQLHESDYNSRHHSSSASYNANAYSQANSHNSGINTHSANLVGETGTKPQSYQSSYSYHKSWERQGDPYVIKPATNGVYDGQTSQRLTDYNSRSQQRYVSNCPVECEPTGHSRVARSYGSEQIQLEQQSQKLEDLGQQTQQQWNNYEDMGQQTQQTFDNLKDLGQQTQQTFGNLEDLGQQTQNKWEDLQNLGQQAQNTWDQTEVGGQEIQSVRVSTDNLGQQTQNNWSDLQDFGQQTQDKNLHLEDLGQQSQTTWEQYADNSQQSQNKFDKLEDLGQQTQNQWDNIQDFGQQTETKLNFGQSEKHNGQETLNIWNQLDKVNQNTDGLTNADQETENKWVQSEQSQSGYDKLQEFGDQKQDKDLDLEYFGQQSQSTWEDDSQKPQNKFDNLENLEQQIQTKETEHSGQEIQSNLEHIEDLGQQIQSKWDSLQNFEQQTQNENLNLENLGQQSQPTWGQNEDTNQQRQNNFNNFEDLGQQTQNSWNNIPIIQEKLDQDNVDVLGQQTQNKWESQEFGQHMQKESHNLEDFGQQSETKWDEKHLFNNQQASKIFDESQKHHRQDTQDTQDIWNQMDQSQSFDLEETQKTDKHESKKPQQNDEVLEAFGVVNQQTGDNQQASKPYYNNPWDALEMPSGHKQKSDSQEFLSNFNTNSNNIDKESSLTNSEQDSINNLWGKINNLNEDFPIDNKKSEFGNINFPISSSSEAHHGTSYNEEFYQHSSSSSSSIPTNGFNHDEFEVLPITKKENDATEKTTKSNDNYQSTTETGHKEFYHNDLTSTTTNKTKNDKDIRPIDIGRGDIGPEDDLKEIHTEYAHKSNNTKVDSLIAVSSSTTNESHNNDEAVELPVELPTEEQTNHHRDEHYKHNINEESHQQNMDWDTEQKNLQQFVNLHTQQQQTLWGSEEQKWDHQSAHWEHHHVEVGQVNDNPFKDNMHYDLGKHNFEQQFTHWNLEQSNQKEDEDIGQAYEELQKQKQEGQITHWESEQSLVNFGQQNSQNMQSNNQQNTESFGSKQGRENSQPHKDMQGQVYNSPMVEENKESDTLTPPEVQTPDGDTTTMKPGFWKSVGNKFKSTKNKIASWFGS